MQVIIPVNRLMGHHVVGLRSFLEYLALNDFRVTIVCSKRNIHHVRQILRAHPDLDYLTSITAIPKLLRRPYMVFIFTLEEWFQKPLVFLALLMCAKKVAVVHYVVKRKSGFLRLLFNWYSRGCVWLAKALGVRLIPISQAARVEANINSSVLSYMTSVSTAQNYSRPSIGKLRILCFGAIRPDKAIFEAVERSLALGSQVQVRVMGLCQDPVQSNRLASIKDSRLALEYGFIDEADKNAAFEWCDYVVIPNKGNDFSNGMLSGPIVDAIVFAKPVLFLEPSIFEGIASFGLNLRELSSLPTAKDWEHLHDNIRVFREKREAEFQLQLRAIFGG